MPRKRFIIRDDSDEYGFYSTLVDTTDDRELGTDGGEPEDQCYGRDWKWVPEELNKLAAENERLREALVGVEAAVPRPECDDCDAIEIARTALTPTPGEYESK